MTSFPTAGCSMFLAAATGKARSPIVQSRVDGAASAEVTCKDVNSVVVVIDIMAGACCRYELYGVVAHAGPLTSSGHYIAYIRADCPPDVTAAALSGRLLPLDATQSTVMPQYVICPSVCP